ncbi:MAG TPA: hypothetical protein VHP30_14525 [Ignavibacteriales bacterium]|nr:hypothetical protein [Ignavibacteriales bacterium]
MQFSPDTEEVLKFLDYITGNDLRKRDDIGAILETGAANSAIDIVNDIIFTGAYFWNLSRTIRKASSATEGLDKLHSEFRISGENLRNLISRLCLLAGDDIKQRFDETYLPLTAGAFRNLTDLGHDLYELKNLQNSMKNKG